MGKQVKVCRQIQKADLVDDKVGAHGEIVEMAISSVPYLLPLWDSTEGLVLGQGLSLANSAGNCGNMLGMKQGRKRPTEARPCLLQGLTVVSKSMAFATFPASKFHTNSSLDQIKVGSIHKGDLGECSSRLYALSNIQTKFKCMGWDFLKEEEERSLNQNMELIYSSSCLWSINFFTANWWHLVFLLDMKLI